MGKLKRLWMRRHVVHVVNSCALMGSLNKKCVKIWLRVKIILPVVLYVLRNTRVLITGVSLIHHFIFPTSAIRKPDCLSIIHRSPWRHDNKFFSKTLFSFRSWHLPRLSRNIPILWNQMIHHHVHRDPPFDFISRPVNPVPTFTSQIFKIYFHTNIPTMLRSLKCSLCLRFSDQNVICIFPSPFMLNDHLSYFPLFNYPKALGKAQNDPYVIFPKLLLLHVSIDADILFSILFSNIV